METLSVLRGEDEGSVWLTKAVIHCSFDHSGSMEAYSCFITLINSLSDTAAINPPFFPGTELQGRQWLMRMWSLLYLCGEFLQSEQRKQFLIDCSGQVWLSVWPQWRAWIWGKPYFLFGVKGQLERMRRWQGQMVVEGHMWCVRAVWCAGQTYSPKYTPPAAHTHSNALFVWGLYRERPYFWYRNLKKKMIYFKRFIFVALAISWIGHDNIALVKAITVISECGNIQGVKHAGVLQVSFV